MELVNGGCTVYESGLRNLPILLLPSRRLETNDERYQTISLLGKIEEIRRGHLPHRRRILC
jgi:hypothetical protein